MAFIASYASAWDDKLETEMNNTKVATAKFIVKRERLDDNTLIIEFETEFELNN